MRSAKEEVRNLLESLPDNCSIEDIQYHLYVAEKINRGLRRAKSEQTWSQEDVEGKFKKWVS